MEPNEYVALANGALQLVEALAPQIEDLAQKGQITTDTQAALRAKLDALRGHSAFSGPEYQTDAPAPAPSAKQ